MMMRNKMFSKSYIIPALELTLDYIVLNYCLLDATCFTHAEDTFIRVTNLHDRTLTAPNITTQLNQCHEKMSSSIVRIRLRKAGRYDRIAVKKPVEEAKQCQKASVVQGVQTLHTVASRDLISTRLVGLQGFELMKNYDPKHTSKLYQSYIKSKEERPSTDALAIAISGLKSHWIGVG